MDVIAEALRGMRAAALEFLVAALAERVERERRACDGILKMYDQAEAECVKLERRIEDLQAALTEAVAIAREGRPKLPAPSSLAACCAPAMPLSFAVAAPLEVRVSDPDPRFACAAAPMAGEWTTTVLDAAAPYRREARLAELEALSKSEE